MTRQPWGERSRREFVDVDREALEVARDLLEAVSQGRVKLHGTIDGHPDRRPYAREVRRLVDRASDPQLLLRLDHALRGLS